MLQGLTEEEMHVIELANVRSDKDINTSVNNIVKAIKILNKEEL